MSGISSAARLFEMTSLVKQSPRGRFSAHFSFSYCKDGTACSPQLSDHTAPCRWQDPIASTPIRPLGDAPIARIRNDQHGCRWCALISCAVHLFGISILPSLQESTHNRPHCPAPWRSSWKRSSIRVLEAFSKHADCPPELNTLQSQVAAVSASPVQNETADVTPALRRVEEVPKAQKQPKPFGGLASGFLSSHAVRTRWI
jgi:hypothetical protein